MTPRWVVLGAVVLVNGVAPGLAVVVMSDTPDPKPINNLTERTLP